MWAAKSAILGDGCLPFPSVLAGGLGPPFSPGDARSAVLPPGLSPRWAQPPFGPPDFGSGGLLLIGCPAGGAQPLGPTA